MKYSEFLVVLFTQKKDTIIDQLHNRNDNLSVLFLKLTKAYYGYNQREILPIEPVKNKQRDDHEELIQKHIELLLQCNNAASPELIKEKAQDLISNNKIEDSVPLLVLRFLARKGKKRDEAIRISEILMGYYPSSEKFKYELSELLLLDNRKSEAIQILEKCKPGIRKKSSIFLLKFFYTDFGKIISALVLFSIGWFFYSSPVILTFCIVIFVCLCICLIKGNGIYGNFLWHLAFFLYIPTIYGLIFLK